ncbi:MAG: hypothetical protein EOR67_30985 [Mesorhizobium sp.]|uniref:hypothetical protein n=1 Tax=Mesorhizobium sp. TaxID=1871066 RepID=UPI000FE959D5|nr:hypothetical protein [Mesorhizobium sp.]RWL80671.1 MAG: hypothetical protein EOR67_30985 [Mesorhizobium sp.]
MRTRWKSFLWLAALAIVAFVVARCYFRTESYRYKLTFAVNTAEGVERGSSVTEATFWEVSFPEHGVMHKLHGEALYLDLGPGRRPLIALLTSQLHPIQAKNYGEYQKKIRWSRDAGPSDNLLTELYGPQSEDVLDDISRLARMRGAHRITPGDLPDLVTFVDIKDPKSVIDVDPNDLKATLGPDVSWNEITLESTDEPVTEGIEKKLTWLPAYNSKGATLDGSPYSSKNTVANILYPWDFYQND